MPQSDAPAGARRIVRPRWLVLGMLVGMVLVAIVARHTLLRAMAAPLIVDQPADSVDAVIVHPFDIDAALYQAAAERLKQSESASVLLIEPQESRTVRYGVLPRFAESAQAQLASLDISRGRIEPLAGEVVDVWDTARALEPWLAEHPGMRVELPVSYFQGSYWRLVLDRSLPPAAADRVVITALPPQWFHESNWWTQRRGVQLVVGQWLLMLHAVCSGEHAARPEPWDLEALEAQLARRRTAANR